MATVGQIKCLGLRLDGVKTSGLFVTGGPGDQIVEGVAYPELANRSDLPINHALGVNGSSTPLGVITHPGDSSALS